MKIKSFFILNFIFCLFLKGQTLLIDTDSLNILSIDNQSLNKYNWIECSINKKDTIIILIDKKLICNIEPKLKLNKINITDNGVNLILNANNIYIDDKLIFPKNMNVYLYICE
jgi:hypothetical protein